MAKCKRCAITVADASKAKVRKPSLGLEGVSDFDAVLPVEPLVPLAESPTPLTWDRAYIELMSPLPVGTGRLLDDDEALPPVQPIMMDWTRTSACRSLPDALTVDPVTGLLQFKASLERSKGGGLLFETSLGLSKSRRLLSGVGFRCSKAHHLLDEAPRFSFHCI